MTDRKPIARLSMRRDKQTFGILTIWPGRFPGTYDISRDKGSERYPRYPLPPEIKTDRVGYLRDLCIEGLKRRYGVDHAAVAARPVVAERLARLTGLPPGQKPVAPDYSGL